MKRAFACALVLFAAMLSAACGAATPASPAPDTGDDAVAHSYPEPLLVFEARERGLESIDLSAAAALEVDVNHCEYGEPTQRVDDGELIAQAVAALEGVTVTGGGDGVYSTGTHYVYRFLDKDGGYIAGFSFQDRMLVTDAGRQPLSGLEPLLELPGIELYRAQGD